VREPWWWSSGTLELPVSSLPLGQDRYERLVHLSRLVRTVPVNVGDMGETHALEVGRIKEDVPEPRHLSDASVEFEHELLSPAMQGFYARVLPRAPVTLQRLQLNVIRTGGFIGSHIDLDSDPRRQVALVFHLPCQYTGGALYTHDAHRGRHCLTPPPDTVVLSRGDILHGVEPVLSGERRTLAAFLCMTSTA